MCCSHFKNKLIVGFFYKNKKKVGEEITYSIFQGIILKKKNYWKRQVN